MDPFVAVAEPSRRRILTELRRRARSVNELAEALEARQPAVSKHLKVLREAGFVTCHGAAQQRIYRLEPGAFREIDAWLAPYRQLWARHLDALERHLDGRERQDDSKRVPARSAGKRRRRP